MRITQFELAAFGPFTERTLDFTAGKTDFHVIYGPNEAGKSSSLRGLKAWLFGFPERTRDDFIHPRTQLLVGGELCESEQSLTFFRRKKRKGDLVDSEGNTLDPALLTPFLGGLDLSLFEALYGIDHDTLVQGGREILARQGEIGETLFSAGAGLGSLHRVLEEMEAEKDGLFRSRASKPLINQNLSLHKTITKEIRALTLPPEQWQGAADRLEQINLELAEAKNQRLQLDRKRLHLERLHRALPLFARQAKIREQQQALGDFRPLPTDFSSRRSAIQQELRTSEERHELAKTRLELVNTKLNKLSPHKPLINTTTQIEESFQRLGEYNKAKKDRPRLEGMRAVLLKEADRLLDIIAPSLPLKQSEQLLPLVQQKKKIAALASRHQALLQNHKEAKNRLTVAGKHLEKTEKILAELREPGDESQLHMAITRGRKAGDIDKRILQGVREQAEKKESFTLRLRQLGLWQGSAAELLGLELPLAQTIYLFRDERQELEQQLGLLNSRVLEIEDELLTLQTRRRELMYGGEIPSEEELLEIRKRRNQGWQLICRNWLDQEDITADAALFTVDSPLPETVYNLILQADTISDRLRREADRVHSFAALRAKEEELTTLLQGKRTQVQDIESALEQHERAWNILWQPLNIVPFSPREMADWRVEMEQLQLLARAYTDLGAGLAQLEAERTSLHREITGVLHHEQAAPPETGELSPLLIEAERKLDILRQERERFQHHTRELEQQKEQLSLAVHELEQVEQELEAWQKRWQEIAILPGQPEAFDPDMAQDVFDTCQQIFSKLKETKALESRLKGMDRDCRLLEHDVEEIAEQVGPDLSGQSVNQIVQQLHQRLTRAQKEQTLHDNYIREANELTGEIKESALSLQTSREAMKKLLVLAGCGQEEELIRAEQDADDHRRLAGQLEELEQDLQQVAGELSLEQLSEQVQAVDADSLPGELHALNLEISGEIDPVIQTLSEQKGEARKTLEQMDGSALAATKAEMLENNLARMHANAEHFLRLQIGVDMLRAEIETFRRRNQDPVLTIASSLFADLTLGSFSGLKADLDDKGEPVLVGIRADSRQPLDVAAMSTGSRDQLYLALRLASLRHRAENGQSMPFIVDDILINFDDERGAATLQVLAATGRKNQVILFTHHSQVAEQAQTLDGVQVHRLA